MMFAGRATRTATPHAAATDGRASSARRYPSPLFPPSCPAKNHDTTRTHVVATVAFDAPQLSRETVYLG